MNVSRMMLGKRVQPLILRPLRKADDQQVTVHTHVHTHDGGKTHTHPHPHQPGQMDNHDHTHGQ